MNTVNTWQKQFNQLRQDHRVPMVLTAFFAMLLLITVANTLITLTAHHAKIALTKTQPIEPLANIADLHLFGVYSANLDNLPTSQLQLTLEGTIVSLETPAQSYALITTPSQPAKVYKVGDTLPGNATVTRIAKHYVVVDDNGTLEKLALPIEIITP